MANVESERPATPTSPPAVPSTPRRRAGPSGRSPMPMPTLIPQSPRTQIMHLQGESPAPLLSFHPAPSSGPTLAPLPMPLPSTAKGKAREVLLQREARGKPAKPTVTTEGSPSSSLCEPAECQREARNDGVRQAGSGYHCDGGVFAPLPPARRPGSIWQGPAYVVTVGQVPGIYPTWNQCSAMIARFSGAVWKKYACEADGRAVFERALARGAVYNIPLERVRIALVGA
ncbi:hypothetical protein CERSUDRAFT_101139 [Gelatoporia subvermispora B]|uniref:Ribonuclease H1 N-terminal domain-containing protein n=1 Tax=Ceriporiopsis subvermispora (strain B) TaxID=914234 RepID=M2Q1F5_CERS8|nr:hypothetical protein CERSUDRAFT_101139 [Gelatoporia subvermispora B]